MTDSSIAVGSSPSKSAAIARASAPRSAPGITPRVFAVELRAVPRHWLSAHPVPTHIVNGLNLLFPVGERFFVRSVKAYLERLDDPALVAEVRSFFAQEGRHASAHDRVNQMLRDQGFEVDSFLEQYRRTVERLERRLSPALRLSVTAAIEHFTAILAEAAFSSPILLEAAPAMRALLAWHALEEIEHRAVAFDVLASVQPSYTLRIAGLVIATATLAGFWFAASRMLLRQDPATRTAPPFPRPPKEQQIIRTVFARGIRDYLRRDFHPRQKNLEPIAAEWIRAHLAERAAELI